MNILRQLSLLLPLLFLDAGLVSPAQATGCASLKYCSEVNTFTTSVADFRISNSGGMRISTVALRFHNKTNKPLILGYVYDSGVVIDDLGNRYRAQNVRAIGTIVAGTSFDPKFSLAPDEVSDARFEFAWPGGNALAGTVFRLELAVREINEVQGNQYALGREHALEFQGLADGFAAGEAVAAGPAAGGTPAATPDSVVVGQVDPCAAVRYCNNEGPFAAQVVHLKTSQTNSMHYIQLDVRLVNLTAEPLMLGYTAMSGKMTDDNGARYTTSTASSEVNHVKGIGFVSRRTADPQFVLQSGESRNVSLEYSRRINGKSIIGTVYSPDFALEQLEVLPSSQVRSTRQFSVVFTDLQAGNYAGEVMAKAAPQTTAHTGTQAGSAANGGGETRDAEPDASAGAKKDKDKKHKFREDLGEVLDEELKSILKDN